MFKRLSLRVKVALALLLWAMLLGAAMSMYQLRAIDVVRGDLDNSIGNEVIQLETLHDIKLYSSQLEGVAANPGGQTPRQIKSEIQKLATQEKNAEDTYTKHLSTQDKQAGVSIDSISKQIDEMVRQANAMYPVGAGISEAQLQAKLVRLDSLQKQSAHAADDAIAATHKRIELREDRAKTSLATTKRDALLAAILLLLLAAAGGFLIASRITRSLEKLRAGAQRMANGDFSEDIQVQSLDEIGQLAVAFDQMAVRMKESYGRLAVEKQRDEAILQGMGEGLVAVDAKGQVVLINQVATDLLELPDKDKAIGTNVRDVFQLYTQADGGDNMVTVDQRPVALALKTGEQLSEIYIIHRADGTNHLLNITVTPIKLDADVAGAIAVIRDVTKEKEVDRMKTEFISLASHQLRTPLSAIKWFTEMLISGDAGELKPDQLDFATNISESTDRMIALVNALLNISRIESGRIVVDPKPTDLKELVTGIVNDLKGKTEGKQQNLIISVHADLPKVNLDPRLISQVYLNLLTNAIKYTAKGGEITVFISKKGEEIISQITDNGYGIPLDQQSRIFQKFFRASNTAKIETDGTGLGLYLIKAIIDSSGGRIWFESKEGMGTTFWFSMPVSGMKPKKGEVTLDA